MNEELCYNCERFFSCMKSMDDLVENCPLFEHIDRDALSRDLKQH